MCPPIPAPPSKSINSVEALLELKFPLGSYLLSIYFVPGPWFEPQICCWGGYAGGMDIHQHFTCPLIYTLLIIWQPAFKLTLINKA